MSLWKQAVRTHVVGAVAVQVKQAAVERHSRYLLQLLLKSSCHLFRAGRNVVLKKALNPFLAAIDEVVGFGQQHDDKKHLHEELEHLSRVRRPVPKLKSKRQNQDSHCNWEQQSI